MLCNFKIQSEVFLFFLLHSHTSANTYTVRHTHAHTIVTLMQLFYFVIRIIPINQMFIGIFEFKKKLKSIYFIKFQSSMPNCR